MSPRHVSTACVALLLACALAVPTLAATPDDRIPIPNADLSEGTDGWHVSTPGWSIDAIFGPDRSSRVLQLKGSSPLGIFLRAMSLDRHRGHLLRLSTRVRLQREGGRAQVWARVDRDDGEPGFFDNMQDRPVVTTNWTDVEIFIAVDGHAQKLTFGGMHFDAGAADFEPFVLEDLGKLDGLDPGRLERLSQGAAERLSALAELLGVVRFFYPDPDQPVTDWDAFSVQAVDRVLAVPNDTALGAALLEVFLPIVPELQVFPTGEPPPRAATPTPTDRDFVFVWEHHGFDSSTSSLYSSMVRSLRHGEFVQARATPGDEHAHFPAVGEVWEGELGAGLSARVPLSLVRSVGQPKRGSVWAPEDPGVLARLRALDRSTRLASVITLWSTMRHFYPYFDVVDADWESRLAPALNAAAEAPGVNAQQRVLRELAAHLQDGHVYVSHGRGEQLVSLPLDWDWLDDKLVVTAVHPRLDVIEVGDIVERIGGQPAAAVLESYELVSSAATARARRRSAMEAALRGPNESTIELRVRHGARSVTVPVQFGTDFAQESRPEPVAELGSGVLYADLTRLDNEAWKAAWPRLTKAKGLVFDMRGYPGGLTPAELFAPLISEAVTSPQWHVPRSTRPGGVPAEYAFSNWTLTPGDTHFSAPMAFLIDERAISYAETCLGIVEAYELGALVGRASAGTNGNITSAWLPGGFEVSFTGMRVLKHDGSTHHGVGVLPTHPVERTRKGLAAGRDEQLEAAMALVLKRR